MITLYNEKNEKIKLISTFEFNDADMGESSISATVSFDKEQDFHPDWYVVYNGEKFRLGVRKPTGKKDTSSLQTSYTLVFKSEREDLKRYTFMDFVELGTGNPQPSSYNVSLYATLSEFVGRFNTNLRYYMGSRWEMVLPDGYMEDGNAVSVAFENASLWDVLLRVYEAFGVRWVIRSAGNVLQIQVGFQEVEIEHIFEYGKGNGLVSVERNNALERIITRLRGRGSEKNLPPDYFHTGDPDTNSFLQATFFKNLMPKSYRDYVRGYNAGSGTGSWAYNQGVADRVSGRNISPVDYAISDKEDLWGVSYGAIEPNEQIFPTLQGATRNGVRLDEVLSVEQVLVDGVREPHNTIAVGIGPGGQESSSGKCGNSQKNGHLADCRDGIEFTIFTDRFQVTNSINASQVRITLVPSYINGEGLPVPVEFGSASTVRSSAELQLVDFAGSANGEVIRTQTISDTDSYLWELDNIPIGDYRFRANVVWSADIQRAEYDPTAGDVVVNVDTRLTGATVKEYARETDKGEFKETFDIEIRDVWGVARNAGESDEDYTYRVWEPRAVSEDMTVMFSDGLLAGEDYEFRIVGFNSDADNLRQTIISAIKPTAEGGWKLTLQKSDAELEAGNIYLPNTMQNAKAGDHFFFVNIAMPYAPYVYDAEERLLAYLDSQLSLKDEEYPSFTITPSKIFCSSFTEADKIQAGAKIRVRNTALVGESYISLYIQSLTKRYSATSLNPEWNLTISDQVVVSGNPVETLQGEVNVLAQRVYSNRSAIQEAVRSLSSTFLRKDGIADTSYSPIEFKKPVKLGEGISDRDFINGDISGKGFGIYTDGEGNRVIEADILVGRVGARFNEVVINQATYSAGKQVFSSAGMVVSRVEDAGTSWRCYFDTKNATVRNYFVVNDGAFCQRFVDSGIRQYWARVTSVGPDYIDISKTDRMEGSFNPIVGDNIAQLGNSTDRSRQAALIIDETREGGGLVTWYDDITNFTLYDKNSVNIGRIAETIEVEGVSNTVYKTWLQVYGSAFIGNRDKSQFMEFNNKTLKLRGRFEVGSTISDAMTVVEDGLIQSTLLKLGYYKDDVFKIMSGTNGLYDENVLGGGIAAWYGGPMADKEADSSLIEYAQSLFRFDGSGYLAGGNITWDEDGAGSVAGGDIKWDKDGAITLGVGIKISGDANETLGSILNLVNKIASWFGEDEDTGAIYVKKKGSEARDFYTYGAISFGGLGESSGSTGGGGITTFDVFVGNNGPYSLQDGKVKLPAYPVVPNALPNPFKLTINGTPYDGSAPVDIEVKAGLDDAQLADYAKKEWVEEQGYIKEIPSDVITEDELGSKGYATEKWVNQQGFLKEQNISHLVTKGELSTTNTNVSNLQTAHNALRNEFDALNGLLSDDTTGYIDTWNEVKSFLNGYADSTDLATILSGINADITKRALKTDLNNAVARIGTLEGYFTNDAANKAIADGNGNNIVDTYATKGALKDVADKVATLQDMWFFDEAHANTIRTLYNVVVNEAISFGGYGESSGTGGGITTVTKQMILDALEYTPYDAANPKGYITSSALSGYATQSWVTNQKYLTAVPSEYITETELTNKDYATKGTTLAHYGITDAYTKTQVDNKLVNYLTTNTTQTVLASGAKIFKGAYGENIYIGGTKSGISIDINVASGGFARAVTFTNSADSFNDYVQFGVFGNSGLGFQNAFISVGEQDYDDAILNIYTDRIDVSGAASFSDLTTHSAGLKIGTTNVTEKTQNSTKYVEIDGNLVVTGAISFGGFGESSGSGGGITAVTKDMVIDALGYTPYNAANPSGYITSSALSGYAKVSDIPSLSGYATQTWVENKGYFASSSFTKANIKSTLGISDWALAATKPTYTKSDVGLGSVTNLAASGYLTDLGSNATNAVSITVGGTTKNISVSTLKTSLGLGSLAYKSSLVASDIPSLDWSKIASGKPTTLSGYGITDAYTKTSADSTFLKLIGGTLTGSGYYPLKLKSTGQNAVGLAFECNNSNIGFLIYTGDSTYKVTDNGWQNMYNLIHSGNISSQSVNYATSAGSATKLANTRTIWGQSFDGTGNVSGALSLNTSKLYWQLDSNNYYISCPTHSGGAMLEYKAYSGHSFLGGNVAIGTTPSTSYKLYVSGSAYTTGNVFINGYISVDGDVYSDYFLIKNRSSNPYYKLTDGSYSGYVQLLTDGSMALGPTSYYSLTVGQTGLVTINGNLVATGSITFGSASDRRLKDNIKSMTDKQAVAVLSALNPVTFNWNSTAYELGKLSGVSDGFIADEYEKLIPNSGRDIWANYRAINYERATGYLVKGWQNHETRLEKAERRIKELENELKQYRRN